MGFAVPADHRVKLKESKKISTKTLPEKLIVIGVLGTVGKQFLKGLEDLDINHLNYSIEIGQYIEKNPGDLWRLAVIQTLV